MDLLQEYKELYYKEIEHSDRLNNKISTCLTILTIIGTAQIFLINELILNLSLSWFFIFYFILCLVSSIMCSKCLICFIKAYSGYEYYYFPITGAKNYIDQIKTNESLSDDKQLAYIKEMMERKFINDAIQNRQQNTKKNLLHRNLNIWLVRTFIVVMFSFLFYLIFLSNFNK